MDQVLDGKTPVNVVPFDAHDKVVRESPVVHTIDEKTGDPIPVHEYPKVVGYAEPADAFAPKEPIVARDAAHEAELLEQLEAAKEKKA